MRDEEEFKAEVQAVQGSKERGEGGEQELESQAVSGNKERGGGREQKLEA